MWGNMIIKSISGKNLIESDHKSLRTAVEYCAMHNIDLSFADLRRARLSGASLDGLRAHGACFWGADLSGADLGLAGLRGADLRCTNLKDACLAESDLAGAGLHGAYFSRTIIEGAVLSGARISCPSFWDCDLASAQDFTGLCYSHRGERDIILNAPPVIVHINGARMVLIEDHVLWGCDLYGIGDAPFALQKTLFSLKTLTEKAMRGPFAQCKTHLSRR